MTRSCFFALVAIVCASAFAVPAYAEQATVPDVVGLPLADAKGLLGQAGFSAQVEGVHGGPIGIVVSQSPGGFATRDTSDPVRLTVGAPTPKPGTGGGPTDIAPTGAAGRGPLPTGPAPEAPAAGALVWNGRAIPEGRLPSSAGPELPSVLGQTLDRARGTLRQWQLKVEQTLAVPQLKGTIVNQWPPAGGSLAAGETITVVVAVTRRPSNDHRYVPQAERKAWREAIALVEKSGFVPQPVSVSSSAADRGRVIAQSPQPGTVELGGQAIRLWVGRGPGGYSAEVTEPAPGPGPAPAVPPADDDLPPAGRGGAPIQPGADQPKPTPQPETPPAGPGDTPQPPPAEPTAVLDAPSLSNPPAGESYPYKYGADFRWTPVRGAAGYELELQEELPSGAWQTTSTTPVSDAKYRPAKVERGRYRWRVRAVAPDGGKGRWSEYRRLYMY